MAEKQFLGPVGYDPMTTVSQHPGVGGGVGGGGGQHAGVGWVGSVGVQWGGLAGGFAIDIRRVVRPGTCSYHPPPPGTPVWTALSSAASLPMHSPATSGPA